MAIIRQSPQRDVGDHFQSGQQLSVQNRPTEAAVQDRDCSTLPPPVAASRFWCASFTEDVILS
jgi:hypothetical protein